MAAQPGQRTPRRPICPARIPRKSHPQRHSSARAQAPTVCDAGPPACQFAAESTGNKAGCFMESNNQTITVTARHVFPQKTVRQNNS